MTKIRLRCPRVVGRPFSERAFYIHCSPVASFWLHICVLYFSPSIFIHIGKIQYPNSFVRIEIINYIAIALYSCVLSDFNQMLKPTVKKALNFVCFVSDLSFYGLSQVSLIVYFHYNSASKMSTHLHSHLLNSENDILSFC